MEKPYFLVIKDSNPSNWVSEILREIKTGGKP